MRENEELFFIVLILNPQLKHISTVAFSLFANANIVSENFRHTPVLYQIYKEEKL